MACSNSTHISAHILMQWEDDDRKFSPRYLSSTDTSSLHTNVDDQKSLQDILKEYIQEERERYYVECDSPTIRCMKRSRSTDSITLCHYDIDETYSETNSDTADNETEDAIIVDSPRVGDSPSSSENDIVMEKVIDNQVYRKFGYV